MLDNIRKAADNLVFRIFLGLIAFAFIGWGIKDVLLERNNFDIVKFSHAKNISEQDFMQTRAEEISRIQRLNGTNLSEEQIKELGINNITLQKLINERILDYIVSYYDLDITDGYVIGLIKHMPAFKNEKGEFDLNIFKSRIRHSNFTEEEYLANVKQQTLQASVLTTFLENFHISQTLFQDLINNLAEIRTVELVEINLKNKPTNLALATPSEEELQNFYNDNKEIFSIPEKRTFIYTIVDKNYFSQKIKVSDNEAQNYFNNYKEEFGGDKANFNKVKPQVKDKLFQQKLEEFKLELAKNLEDEVAAGTNLKEIAEKFDLKLQKESYQTKETILSKELLRNFTSQIFEMSEGELSYPTDIAGSNGFALFQIEQIVPTRIEEFEKSKNLALQKLQENKYQEYNKKLIEKIASNYKPGIIDTKYANEHGILINPNYKISKNAPKQNFAPVVLSSIFETKINSHTPVFIFGDRAFFAHVKASETSQATVNEISKNSKSSIENIIKQSVVEELISYFTRENNIKVNYNDRIFKQQNY